MICAQVPILLHYHSYHLIDKSYVTLGANGCWLGIWTGATLIMNTFAPNSNFTDKRNGV